MKSALVLLLLVASTAFAHPGVGIVMDSRGNVFYTDLHHVWMIAPDGSKSIAVSNVHTHELCIDTNDNLYGEHLWYNGERLDTWGSRVWMRSPDGRVADVIPAHPGFTEKYSFVRDGAGNMYWADRAANTIRKRALDGTITAVARSTFNDIRWMTVTPEGTVYLIDTRDLVRVTPDGRVAIVARGLTSWTPMRVITGTRHALMGLWTDRAGNVYVADYGGTAVKRVGRDGRVSVAARSSLPWSPTGGMFDPQGNLWLLEYSTLNSVRVRRIAPDRKETIF